MRNNDYKSDEQLREEDERRTNRLVEQQNQQDYLWDDFNGGFERCEDCGSKLNSHGHCPSCDY